MCNRCDESRLVITKSLVTLIIWIKSNALKILNEYDDEQYNTAILRSFGWSVA